MHEIGNLSQSAFFFFFFLLSSGSSELERFGSSDEQHNLQETLLLKNDKGLISQPNRRKKKLELYTLAEL